MPIDFYCVFEVIVFGHWPYTTYIEDVDHIENTEVLLYSHHVLIIVKVFGLVELNENREDNITVSRKDIKQASTRSTRLQM